MNCKSLLIATCLMACTSAMAAKGESKMPMLKWAGKEKVVNHHNDVPFRVLERKCLYEENRQNRPQSRFYGERPKNAFPVGIVEFLF